MGINVYEDADIEDDDDFGDTTNVDSNAGVKSDFAKPSNEFALMTAPPRHVLKALDEKNRNDKSGHYVVGFDSANSPG